MIELGKRYKDVVTGFEGVATSTHEYLHGCIRWTLTAPGKDGAGPVTETFDEPALVEVAAEQLAGARMGGGDRQVPARP